MPALKLKDKNGDWIPLPTIKGADGKSAYQQAVEAGYTGTEAEFYTVLESLKNGPFLPKKGGTMTGRIDMGEKEVVNVSGIGFYRSGKRFSLSINDDNALEMIDPAAHPIRITGVLGPIAATDAANKGYVDSKAPLLFTGKTVAVSAWASNSTYSGQGYNWRASVALDGVTTSHRPDVAFGAADAVGGNFAPVADSYNGGVYIYCKTKPTATMTIPSIVCVKGA